MSPFVSPSVTIPQPPAWLGNLDPEYQVRFLDPAGNVHWESNKGPQTWALLCPFDEILFGGRRGGGKSQWLIAWFGMGDPTLPAEDPAHYSYLNDPTFRGLMLRKEYQSMAEFVDEAMDFFRVFDCRPKDDPVVFEFKSGAKIYTNHLGSPDAYEKYRGWNLTKIGVEELTQIPDLRWYLKLLGSLRSKTGAAAMRTMRGRTLPKLRTQIGSTTNPDGPGASWVKERFVHVLDGAGKPIPWNTPMTDEITGLTRIFMPARLQDNPYLRDDKKYMGMLLSQDEVTRAQWIEGDWDAGTGIYFRDYRPDGPRGQEEADKYPWARHVIDSVPLESWWTRLGSGDWGYQHNAAFHKFCFNERDKRLHVYDELVVRQIGSFELGVILAKWWTPELETLPDHRISIALSPDAFSKTDATKTKAEQMEAGIKEVLGPYGAMLLRYNEDERSALSRDPKAAALMFERRKLEMEGKMWIALTPANNNRVDGWAYIRDLLRFRPLMVDVEQDPDYLKHIFATRGMQAYENELAMSKKQRPEVLPQLVLWKCCKGADRFLKTAMHDEPPKGEDVRKFDSEDGVGGDDPGDSLRYGCMQFREVKTTIPVGIWVNRRVGEFQEQNMANFGCEITDPTRLAMIRQRQIALHSSQNPPAGGSFTLPRLSSHRWTQ